MPDAQFTIPAAPVLAVLAVAGAVALWRCRPARPALWGVALVYALAVVDLTLLPIDVALGEDGNQAAWTSQFNVVPVLPIDARTFVLNVALFVPLGVLLPLLTHVRGPRRVAGVALAASASIEVVQLVLNLAASAGRQADVNDLLANVAGALVGLALYSAATRYQ